ncbi:unnamed protein product [Prorocentrum cordatum]|uniref:Uncharacterized protein n=1 Tax=Prorocentrum cordatum TaxID=2364126 RepID=A0ABN9W6I4_9DINO|nr:unnamed protein product [Polarella glacialis]
MQGHLLRCAVEAAAREAVSSCRQGGAPCAACSMLEGFEAALEHAGEHMGVQGKATTEDVRRALRSIGQHSLAKEWEAHRAGRRALAHPGAAVPERVRAALAKGGTPHMIDSLKSDDGFVGKGSFVDAEVEAPESTLEVDSLTADADVVHGGGESSEGDGTLLSTKEAQAVQDCAVGAAADQFLPKLGGKLVVNALGQAAGLAD